MLLIQTNTGIQSLESALLPSHTCSQSSLTFRCNLQWLHPARISIAALFSSYIKHLPKSRWMNKWSYSWSCPSRYLLPQLVIFHTWFLKIHTPIVTLNWISRHLFWYGGLCSFTNTKVSTNSVDITSTHIKAIDNLYEDLFDSSLHPYCHLEDKRSDPIFSFYAVDFTLQTINVLVVCPAAYWPIMVALGFFGISFFSPIWCWFKQQAIYSSIELLQVDIPRYKLWRLRSLHLEWNGYWSSLTLSYTQVHMPSSRSFLQAS